MNQNANVNRNADVNVNRNANVNVNRDVNVNVHGGYYGGCCYQDNSWGAYAAGAVTGAVVGAAVASSSHTTTTVVAAPAVGSLVGVLPGSCAAVGAGGAVVYNCNSVYYRPFYQGTTLVYQVVTYPSAARN